MGMLLFFYWKGNKTLSLHWNVSFNCYEDKYSQVR